MLYEKELAALKRVGRYRTRSVVDETVKDFASNDYLGLAHNTTLHHKTCAYLDTQRVHAPKASMLVHGYHQIHKDFEEALAKANGFEDAIVMGSGFNANIALIEALTRKGDTLFMDELYHASGVLASHIGSIDVVYFQHNNMQELRTLLKHSRAKRKIIAVEGIYSMDGDMCPQEVFAIADECPNCVLVVDEAHSSGVVGDRLMGVFDYYNIAIQPNYIKMGTLGKAYGSFGAFIVASTHITEYLLNRAKPVIYATSLSLYDTKLAHFSLEYILNNTTTLQKEIALRKEIIQKSFALEVDGLIVPLRVGDNTKVLEIKNTLLAEGFGVGAIRQPTVSSAIVRLIARLGESCEDLLRVCELLQRCGVRG